MIKRSRVPNITLTEYEGHLAQNISALNAHQAMVATMLSQLIVAGGIDAKLNFKSIKSTVLTTTNTRKMIKDRPGWDHWEMKLYEHEFGKLETNGKFIEGHRLWKLDGVEGVMVPQKKITSIRFSEEMAATIESQAGSSEDMSEAQLGEMQQSVAASFWNETSGGVGTAVDRMLGAAGGAASSSSSAWDPSTIVGAAGEGGGVVPEDSPLLLPAPKKKAKLSQPTMPSKKTTSPAKNKTPGSSHDGESPCGGGKPPGASSPSEKEQASRGRKKADLVGKTQEYVDTFQSSVEANVLWWGSESGTMHKELTIFVTTVKTRIRNSDEMSEVNGLRQCEVKMLFMVAVFDACRRCGLGTPEFWAMYDLQIQGLSLHAEKVDICPPAFLSAHRGLRAIGEITDLPEWMRASSTKALSDSNVEDIAGEQERLWAEKFAVTLRINVAAERRSNLNVLFDLTSEVVLQDEC